MELSLNQLMRLTGHSFRTIKKRLESLKPVRIDGRAIFYDSSDALKAIYLPESTDAIAKQLTQVELEIEQEKLQKIRMENGKSLGELASVADVAKAVEKEYAYVRAQFRSLPSALAKPLSMVTDPVDVHERLTEAVNTCLAELTMDKQYELADQQLESVRSAVEEEPSSDVDSSADDDLGGMGGLEEISFPGSVVDTGTLED